MEEVFALPGCLASEEVHVRRAVILFSTQKTAQSFPSVTDHGPCLRKFPIREVNLLDIATVNDLLKRKFPSRPLDGQPWQRKQIRFLADHDVAYCARVVMPKIPRHLPDAHIGVAKRVS